MRFLFAALFAFALSLAPAHAQNLTLNNAGKGSPTISVAFGSFPADVAPGSTTGTLTGLSIGTADAQRYVVTAFIVSGASAPTVSGVTIGGISATRLITTASATVTYEMWIAPVPTGTTANIVVTTNINQTHLCGVTWSVVGLRQPFNPVQTATLLGAASPQTVNPLTAPGDAGVGFMFDRAATATQSSWVNDASQTCFSTTTLALHVTPVGSGTPSNTLTTTVQINYIAVTLN